MIKKELKDGVLIMTFMHEKRENPFGDKMQQLLLEDLALAEEDDDVKSVVLTGGLDRSFCVGGDFSEIIRMDTSYESVEKVLDQIIDLYIDILKVTKPIISAVDHYAIGLGFQMFLLTDYRIVSDRAKFIMPELKNGAACTLGGALIEFLVNRSEMMKICYDCERLDLDYLAQIGIINKKISPENLLQFAFEKAKTYGAYPSVPFRNTKRLNNSRFIKAIEAARKGTVVAHHLTLSGNSHKAHMHNVLKT